MALLGVVSIVAGALTILYAKFKSRGYTQLAEKGPWSMAMAAGIVFVCYVQARVLCAMLSFLVPKLCAGTYISKFVVFSVCYVGPHPCFPSYKSAQGW